jgi:hypothetical protein
MTANERHAWVPRAGDRVRITLSGRCDLTDRLGKPSPDVQCGGPQFGHHARVHGATGTVEQDWGHDGHTYFVALDGYLYGRTDNLELYSSYSPERRIRVGWTDYAADELVLISTPVSVSEG